MRTTDTVARLGGDEFVVMLEDLGGDPQAATERSRIVAEKILGVLREPFDLDGYLHYTTSSIGVTSLNGQHDNVSDLLKQADLAMYQAKSLGRNAVCFFNPDMQAAVSAKAAVKAAVMCEDVAKSTQLACALGTPTPLPQDAVDSLYARYQNVYGQDEAVSSER